MKTRDWLPWKYEIVPWMTRAFTPVKSRSLSNKMKHDFVIVSWTLKVSIFFKSTSPFRKLKKTIIPCRDGFEGRGKADFRENAA